MNDRGVNYGKLINAISMKFVLNFWNFKWRDMICHAMTWRDVTCQTSLWREWWSSTIHNSRKPRPRCVAMNNKPFIELKSEFKSKIRITRCCVLCIPNAKFNRVNLAAFQHDLIFGCSWLLMVKEKTSISLILLLFFAKSFPENEAEDTQ